MHHRRFVSKKIMVIILSKNIEDIKYVIKHSIVKLETNIYYEGYFYKAYCYGERDDNHHVFKSTYIPLNTWVYEYHEEEGYIYQAYNMKKLKDVDLPTVIDVLYRTGQVSIEKACIVALRKRIFLIGKDNYYKLLEIEKSTLFKSIIYKLVDFYNNEVTNLQNYNQIVKINKKIDSLLRAISPYANLCKDLCHLSYDQFLDIVEER